MREDDVFDIMMDIDGGEILLHVERTKEAQLRDGLDATLSQQAMEDLLLQFQAFVVTRMLRYQGATGIAPQSVKVAINMEVQG